MVDHGQLGRVALQSAVAIGQGTGEKIGQLHQFRFVRVNVLDVVDHRAGEVVYIVAQHFAQLAQFEAAARVLDVEVNGMMAVGRENAVEQRELHLVIEQVVVALIEGGVVELLLVQHHQPAKMPPSRRKVAKARWWRGLCFTAIPLADRRSRRRDIGGRRPR